MIDLVLLALAADASDAVMGRDEFRRRQHRDAGAALALDGRDLLAFFVEQEGRHLERGVDADFPVLVLGRFLADDADDRQRQRFHRPHPALAAAAGADDAAGLVEGGPQPLARHFEQAKARNPADLDPGAVGF